MSNIERVPFESNYSQGNRKWECPRCNTKNVTHFNVRAFKSKDEFKTKPMQVMCGKCKKVSITVGD